VTCGRSADRAKIVIRAHARRACVRAVVRVVWPRDRSMVPVAACARRACVRVVDRVVWAMEHSMVPVAAGARRACVRVVDRVAWAPDHSMVPVAAGARRACVRVVDRVVWAPDRSRVPVAVRVFGAGGPMIRMSVCPVVPAAIRAGREGGGEPVTRARLLMVPEVRLPNPGRSRLSRIRNDYSWV